MKKILICVCLFFLAGCSSVIEPNPKEGHAVIDWVDFIKLNGKEYNGIYSGAISDPTQVGEEIGEVKFKVADNVENPNYKTQDGDAAFLEKGTKIYAIERHPNQELVAVKDGNEINGYRVYYSREDFNNNYLWHYKNVQKDKVEKVDIYSIDNDSLKRLLKTIEGDKLKQFFAVLDKGKNQPGFSPDTKSGDPKMFKMVFYTDNIIAYEYSLFYYGRHYYWNPWDTVLLTSEIEPFLK